VRLIPISRQPLRHEGRAFALSRPAIETAASNGLGCVPMAASRKDAASSRNDSGYEFQQTIDGQLEVGRRADAGAASAQRCRLCHSVWLCARYMPAFFASHGSSLGVLGLVLSGVLRFSRTVPAL